MKRRSYSKETMKKALNAVRGGMRITAAARNYGIPRSSLYDYVTGKYSEVPRKRGPKTLLTPQAEQSVVEWVLSLEKAGLPLCKSQLKATLSRVAKDAGKPDPFVNDISKGKWFSFFLERHPLISRRLNQNFTTTERKVVDNIKQWFHDIKLYIGEKKLETALKDPRRIFSADEAAFSLCPNVDKLVLKKDDKVTNSKKKNEEFIPVLMTANAAGDVVPPMVSFPFEGIPASVANHFPDTWGIGKSDKGWMTNESFHEYVTDVLHPWVVSRNIELPVALFINGHNLLVTKHLSDFCARNEIELVGLYPQSTRYAQPIDEAVYNLITPAWKEAVREWCMYHKREPVRKEEFAPLLKEVIDYTLEKEKVESGFKRTGLTNLTFQYQK